MNNKKRIKLFNVPCLLIEPEAEKKNATLFIFHGWGSNIENQIFLASIFSKWGYQVILPEILFHNSRNPLTDPFSKAVTEQYFWKTILHTVIEVPHLIDDAQKQGYTKGQKLILAGSSMGGFIAAGAFVQIPGIHALLNINGSGSWEVSEKEFQREGANPTTFFKNLQEFNPVNFLDTCKNRPILLLHGSNDSFIVPSAQKDFYEKAILSGATNITLKMFPNINHTISLPMIESALNWLEEILVDK